MVVLYYKVKHRQDMIYIEAKTVAQQAVIYLSPLYWATVFFLIAQILFYSGAYYDKGFGFAMFGTVNVALFSFWTMIVYRYFSIDRENFDETILDSSCTKFSSGGDRNRQDETCPAREINTSRKSRKPRNTIFSFNIFDGNNASGAFARFIHDGDSDDERVDNKETAHWKTVQDHI